LWRWWYRYACFELNDNDDYDNIIISNSKNIYIYIYINIYKRTPSLITYFFLKWDKRKRKSKKDHQHLNVINNDINKENHDYNNKNLYDKNGLLNNAIIVGY